MLRARALCWIFAPETTSFWAGRDTAHAAAGILVPAWARRTERSCWHGCSVRWDRPPGPSTLLATLQFQHPQQPAPAEVPAQAVETRASKKQRHEVIVMLDAFGGPPEGRVRISHRGGDQGSIVGPRFRAGS